MSGTALDEHRRPGRRPATIDHRPRVVGPFTDLILEEHLPSRPEQVERHARDHAIDRASYER